MTAAGDYKTVQDHRRSCRGGVEKRHSRFARPLWPSQHSTPCEGEEGAGVLAPISPCCRQMKQLVDRRDSVACGSSLQLLIPAFCRPVVGKGPDPIWRPVAYVVSKRFNTPEPSFLKKPAQPATHIRLGDPHGPSTRWISRSAFPKSTMYSITWTPYAASNSAPSGVGGTFATVPVRSLSVSDLS